MKELHLDTRTGGLGDVWMRLHALYALAALSPAWRLRVAVAPALGKIAEIAFGSRLTLDARPERNAITFSHLGLRDLAPRIMRGERFIPAFQVTLQHDGAGASLRDRVNAALFSLVAATGRVLLTDPRCVEVYSGWLQISSLPPARAIPWETARMQFECDLPAIRARLHAIVPEKPNPGLLIFPSGTSFQVMPPSVAQAQFPEAIFAFHPADCYQDGFAALGLKIVHFDTPESLLALASRTQHVCATDSFPSHLLQTYSARTVVALSHYPRRRIIHPGFDGHVLDSTAPCCPCITKARREGSRCPAGNDYCLVWSDGSYLKTLESVIQTAPTLGPASPRL